MNTHKNYFEIEADTHYDLGLRRGELFGEFLRDTLAQRKEHGSWKMELERARWYVAPATEAFPELVQEVHGYAEGARACFEETWMLILEDELAESDVEKCTTIVTNNGSLIGHNEDWERDAKEAICVLKKTVQGLSTFELCYMNTLGGNAIGINSHGFVHAINSLAHVDNRLGVPKNLVARWLSESSDPDSDYRRLAQLKRASGYHHSVVSAAGKIWSIECSAQDQILTKPRSPFVHTNHFLSELARVEGGDAVPGTRARLRRASEEVSESMSVDEMKHLLSDTSQGRTKSILNDRTIGRMIVDTKKMVAHVWMLRERERGWLSYPLAFEPAQAHSAVGAHAFDSVS
jgi:predicted choloylglycine hydrolase